MKTTETNNGQHAGNLALSAEIAIRNATEPTGTPLDALADAAYATEMERIEREHATAKAELDARQAAEAAAKWAATGLPVEWASLTYEELLDALARRALKVLAQRAADEIHPAPRASVANSASEPSAGVVEPTPQPRGGVFPRWSRGELLARLGYRHVCALGSLADIAERIHGDFTAN